MTNEELRQEFERLPEIVNRLVGVKYSYLANRYLEIAPSANAEYINGAWYAYQAQHEKYTKIIKTIIEMQEGLNKANEMIRNAKQTAWQVAMQDAILKQGLGVLHGENVNESANAVGEVLFDKEQMQKYFGENVRIHLDEQDSDHD